jgi:hypothetical protein
MFHSVSVAGQAKNLGLPLYSKVLSGLMEKPFAGALP